MCLGFSMLAKLFLVFLNLAGELLDGSFGITIFNAEKIIEVFITCIHYFALGRNTIFIENCLLTIKAQITLQLCI